MERFTHAGLTFEIRDSGPRDGDAVVCLHGFPQDGTSYDAVVPRLVERGLRVLVPDQRGYSPGARPPGRTAYALPALVDDVLALLDQAGVGAAHVVGHDWGGAVAWALAGRHPERVRSLTALSTPHPAALRNPWQPLHSVYMAYFQLPWLPEATALALGGSGLRAALRGSGLPAEHTEHYLRRMREPGALSAALGWYRSLPAAAGFRTGRVTVPTAYVWGRRDPFFARASAEGTDRYVTGPYVVHALDAGHWLPETRPAEVADAVLEVALP